MKVLLVDLKFTGHHGVYVKNLVKDVEDIEFVLLLPTQLDVKYCVSERYKGKLASKKSLFNYILWLIEIKKIANANNVDVIHFLDGNFLLRYFGFGFKLFRNYRIVTTFHHLHEQGVRFLSTKRILRKIDIGVFHTEYMCYKLKQHKINNIVQIEYPSQYDYNDVRSGIVIREQYGFTDKDLIILAIGETRYNKGLDLLLNALNSLECDFKLLIAGKEVDFDIHFVNKLSSLYSDKVTFINKYLSDMEIKECFVMSNIIVLPYRESFSGASGPLTEGVFLKKVVIGPNCKSIGHIIEKNDLGYTFEVEDVNDLAKMIEVAIKSDYSFTNNSSAYRNSISVSKFQESYLKVYRNSRKK